MTTSSEFKARARAALGGKYWACFLGSLVYVGISAVIGGIFGGGVEESFFSGLIFLAASVFILCPLEVGVANFFINSALNVPNLSDLFAPFKYGYANAVKAILLMMVKTFLWSLLFVIPGIVKSYEYAMIPYIAAENPDMSTSEMFALSKEMMNGNKMRLFMLQLSFIGWILLSGLTLGIGTFFLAPYMQAANTEFYFEVKGSNSSYKIID